MSEPGIYVASDGLRIALVDVESVATPSAVTRITYAEAEAAIRLGKRMVEMGERIVAEAKAALR